MNRYFLRFLRIPRPTNRAVTIPIPTNATPTLPVLSFTPQKMYLPIGLNQLVRFFGCCQRPECPRFLYSVLIELLSILMWFITGRWTMAATSASA